VLVVDTTAPPWTPLFATAAAVVSDTGGILSHCAVVAREYGIPAVVGVHEATTRLVTGQRVRVDGTAGTIVVVDVAATTPTAEPVAAGAARAPSIGE
jgi:pyruvate,water dikinase